MATSSASSSKAEPSCPTVPSTRALTGHYRAGKNLYSVYKGSRGVVLNTPTPQEAQCPQPVARNPDFRRPTYITPACHTMSLSRNIIHGTGRCLAFSTIRLRISQLSSTVRYGPWTTTSFKGGGILRTACAVSDASCLGSPPSPSHNK
ncbi:hypothetical protein MSAN_02494000 [Mycena sanguinolenta]|uniref:Uncharacterized protein n=1 Tax=Mycena sanguinolenta TaxID=230812 RepID=A0A8H6WQ66_9AGAR|nr:hypothetical protein MSAN_02494000 [Mycena sanguinolenta]